jgi:serine/threonine protein kinase
MSTTDKSKNKIDLSYLSPPKIEIYKQDIPSTPPQRKRTPMSLSIQNLNMVKGQSLSAQNSPNVESSLDRQMSSVEHKSPSLIARNYTFQSPDDTTRNSSSNRSTSFANKKALDLGSDKSREEVTERLTKIKKETDDDCRVFDKELAEMKKPPKGIPSPPNSFLDHGNFNFTKQVQSQLAIYSQKIQKSTIDELKDGLYRNIVDELARLNKTAEIQKNPDEYIKESRKMIRKLMYVFGRCARIMEMLRQSSTFKETLKSPDMKVESPRLPSQKSTIGAILSKFGFGKVEVNSPVPKLEVKQDSIHYQPQLCRICEEWIPARDYESHCKLCQTRQEIESREITIDDKLKRLASMMKTMLKQHLEEVYLYELFTALIKIAKTAGDVPFDQEGKNDVELLLDDIKQIFEKVTVDKNTLSYIKKLDQYMNTKSEIISDRIRVGGKSKKKEKIKISDFDVNRNPIGKGAYGRVFLARKKNTQDIFAIKVLKREETNKKKQYQRIITERNIMSMGQYPLVVQLFWSFQGKEYLYLVMEYLPGGDLLSLLRNECYFSEDMARHYAAEVILALEYIHSLKIVHRDLKPDNLLIGKDGHLRLSDFGLSDMGLYQTDYFMDEILVDKSMSEDNTCDSDEMAGTPDYLAPELLMGQEHSFPVDLWALGVMIFEFLTGCPPFNDETPENIFDNILALDIPWPEEGLRPQSIDLIKKLLVHDPKERLTLDQVKKHKFFEGVDWKHVMDQKPPYIPPEVDFSELFKISLDEFKNDSFNREDPLVSQSPKMSYSFINTQGLAKMNFDSIKKEN